MILTLVRDEKPSHALASVPIPSVQAHVLNALSELRLSNLQVLENIDAWQQVARTLNSAGAALQSNSPTHNGSFSSSSSSLFANSPVFMWNGYDYVCKMQADLSALDDYSSVLKLTGFSMSSPEFGLFVLPNNEGSHFEPTRLISFF
jgi:hypothetical protein